MKAVAKENLYYQGKKYRKGQIFTGTPKQITAWGDSVKIIKEKRDKMQRGVKVK